MGRNLEIGKRSTTKLGSDAQRFTVEHGHWGGIFAPAVGHLAGVSKEPDLPRGEALSSAHEDFPTSTKALAHQSLAALCWVFWLASTVPGKAAAAGLVLSTTAEEWPQQKAVLCSGDELLHKTRGRAPLVLFLLHGDIRVEVSTSPKSARTRRREGEQ